MRWLLACFLLFGSREPMPYDGCCLKELQALAVGMEIMDERETKFIFVKAAELEADLAMIRRRERELRGAPYVIEGERFPERTIVNDQLIFNRAYRKWLEDRQQFDHMHGDELRVVIRETEALYQAWDAMRDARCEYYYISVRRYALKRLRELLGEDDFADGALPPIVPYWRFWGPN